MIPLFLYFEFEEQKIKIKDLESRVEKPGPADTHTQLIDLQRRHDSLLLITQGIWSLLQNKFQLSEKELLKVIEEIDLKDGFLDGRARSNKKLWKCEKCGRENNPRFTRCLGCDEYRTSEGLTEPFKKA